MIDFEAPGVQKNIAQLRYNHYQKKRITKLTQIGEMLKQFGGPGSRFVGKKNSIYIILFFLIVKF